MRKLINLAAVLVTALYTAHFIGQFSGAADRLREAGAYEWLVYSVDKFPSFLYHPFVSSLSFLIVGFAILNRRLDWIGPADEASTLKQVSPQNPEPDTWLRDAIFYAVHGRWLGEFEEALNRDGDADKARLVLRQMRQYAHIGHIKIWGKKSEEDGAMRIRTDYWENHRIVLFSIWTVPEEVVTEGAPLILEADLTDPLPPVDGDGVIEAELHSEMVFTSLRVNHRQIEHLFKEDALDPLLLLDEAAKIVYRETRAADMTGPANEKDIIQSSVLSLLIDGRAKDPVIYGCGPLSSEMIPIPLRDLENIHLGSDNKSLLDRNTQPAKVKWRNLSIRRSDLSRHIERQKEDVRQHLRKYGKMPL